MGILQALPQVGTEVCHANSMELWKSLGPLLTSQLTSHPHGTCVHPMDSRASLCPSCTGAEATNPWCKTLQRFLIPSCWWNTSKNMVQTPRSSTNPISICTNTAAKEPFMVDDTLQFFFGYPLVNQPGKEPAQLFKRNRNYRRGMDIQVRWPFNFFFFHGPIPIF